MTARLLLGLFFIFVSTGCNRHGESGASRNEEELMDDRIKYYEDLAGVLVKISDERTAKETLTRVQDLCGKLKSNRQQTEKFKKDKEKEKNPPKGPSETVRKRQDEALKKAVDRVKVEYARLRTGVPGVRPNCDEVQVVLNQAGIFP